MLELSGQPLSLAQIVSVARMQETVAVLPAAPIEAARRVVDDVLTTGRVVYGINTGFGKLSDVQIPTDQVQLLQENLVRSHACGFGEPLADDEARVLMLLRANVIAKGHSGARREVVELLCAMINSGIVPWVPARGSVGASGDLAPLAHLALVLMGEGKAKVGGDWVSGGHALEAVGLAPLRLEAKEGLALLNGTQAIGAVGSLALVRASRLVQWATIAGAMSLEALTGTPVAFDARIHEARGQAGQVQIAKMLRDLLAGSEIRESHRENDPRVQDAYCLRCMPQVHGPTLECLNGAINIFEIESGAATDNPLVFAEGGDILSGGNFHGAPLAMALDHASIAMTMLASIEERRIDRMQNPDLSDGLPPFLAHRPGLESGFMIAHVAAVAALNEARVLSHPACIDNCTTSAAKEDHVSMGMTSALKFKQIVALCAHIVATELVAAAQGLEYRKPLRPGAKVLAAYEWVRSMVPATQRDEPLGEPISKVANALLESDGLPSIV
ncbi:MAG: histidine ammonia-lyase [Fimbriimonadaceae bacterium]|nr:histidine ammonia-lyase [Fimbriimonadaceae bacterium]